MDGAVYEKIPITYVTTLEYYHSTAVVLHFPVPHFPLSGLTPNLFLHFPVMHFPPCGFIPNVVLHFPVLHFPPSGLQGLLVLHFPVLHFTVPHFQRTRA